MGAVVAVAGVNQRFQRMGHVLKTPDLLFQFDDMALREALNLDALPGVVSSQAKKIADLGN